MTFFVFCTFAWVFMYCIISYVSSCIFMSIYPSSFCFGFESYFSEVYCPGAPEGRLLSLRLWMKSWLSAEFSPLLCSHNSVWFTAALPHWGVISSVICWKVWLDWVTKAAVFTTRPCVSHMQVSEKQTQSSCHISLLSFSSFLCSKRSSVTPFTSMPLSLIVFNTSNKLSQWIWNLLQIAF